MIPSQLIDLQTRIRESYPSRDTAELLALTMLMAEAIDRALNACPFCRAGTCTAEAHTWLKDASGWRFQKNDLTTAP